MYTRTEVLSRTSRVNLTDVIRLIINRPLAVTVGLIDIAGLRQR